MQLPEFLWFIAHILSYCNVSCGLISCGILHSMEKAISGSSFPGGGRYGFIVWLNKFLLMLRTEEVVHCLHGIECFEWNLDEDGVPIAHGAVPKAGEFKG